MKQDEDMKQDADSQDNVPELMGCFDAVPFSQAVPFSARSSARSLTPVKLRPAASNVWHQDAVHGHAKVSEQLRPFCCSSPMLRLKRLKQLGICAETFPTAEHTRFQHSLAVGQLSRDFGKYLSQHLRQSAVGDLYVEDCRATPTELLQLELAGYAHDLGHGPYSHLWEKFMKLSQEPGDKIWEHEDMSEKLLDLAVKEACEVFKLPEDHFLRNVANITAAKNMIAGGSKDVTPEKAWLYSIVCNKRSGLDTDKMDYLLRDQLNVFADKPCKFQRREQLKELLDSARVVNQNGETEIAIDMSCGTIFIERVNDVFQARAIMHEKVYQSGSVIANEELIVRLLRLVDPVFGYSKMSHDPAKFLTLDDNVFDDIRRKQTNDLSPDYLELLTKGKNMLALLDQRLGPQHVQMARKVPSVLTQGSSASEISEVVKQRVMQAVWKESNTTEEQVWTKITDISEGRKDDKAVQFVTFFRSDGDCDMDEDGVELQTTRFTEESLRSQYGLRIEEFHGARMCFCHLLFWKDSHDQEEDMQQLWEVFDKHWEAFKKDYEGPNAPKSKRKRLEQEEVVPESDSD